MLGTNDQTESLILDREVISDEEPPSFVAECSTNESEDKTEKFRRDYIPGITDEEWNDWHWQIRNSFRRFSQLEKFFGVRFAHSGRNENKDLLPLRITPYYASLIDFSNPSDPLFKCVVPSAGELHLSKGESSDPLHEGDDCPVKNLVHRYPDRVLFLITGPKNFQKNCFYVF